MSSMKIFFFCFHKVKRLSLFIYLLVVVSGAEFASSFCRSGLIVSSNHISFYIYISWLFCTLTDKKCCDFIQLTQPMINVAAQVPE